MLCFAQEKSLDQIVEELTACRVEHEKLALAIDSSRHQLHVSGLDITSEGKPQCVTTVPWGVCNLAVVHTCISCRRTCEGATGLQKPH